MRWRFCLLLLVLASTASAQMPDVVVFDTPPAHAPADDTGWRPDLFGADTGTTHSGTQGFSNFIGFMSNPLQNIDPRSLTQVVPLFLGSSVSATAALPSVDAQVFGPAISIALDERFSIGLNQGGYAFAQIDRGDRRRPLLNRIAANRGREFGGSREGFLNLGGYAQFTFIRDVESQFLAAAGVRVVAPCGSYELFQGKGPALIAPYLTVGKEIGNFHLLATGGYQFPARSGDRSTELFYLNAHVDRQFCGWIYPLVEVNWTNHATAVDVNLPTRQGFFNFGNFESTGNVVTVAAGVNLVLIRDRLEFGAAYTRSVATQRNIDIDAVIVKMVLRY